MNTESKASLNDDKIKHWPTARLYAIRGLVATQAFYPAQTVVLADRKEARNPFLHIAAKRYCDTKSYYIIVLQSVTIDW